MFDIFLFNPDFSMAIISEGCDVMPCVMTEADVDVECNDEPVVVVVADVEAVEAGAEDWNDEDYANGGYYDENGEWVEASGYYDENGDWVETGGYYDESGEWVEYAGYYDENGEWVDVEVPETGFPEEGTEPHVEHQQTEDACDQYYEDTGGGHGMLG